MFRRRKDAQPVEAPAAPAEVFLGLRSQVLNLDADSVGIRPVCSGVATWGCVMDTGHQIRWRPDATPPARFDVYQPLRL
jgi:hypothetical protein